MNRPRQAGARPRLAQSFAATPTIVALAALFGFFCGKIKLPLGDGASADPAGTAAIRGAPGPWGALESTRIDIEPPPELIRSLGSPPPARWFFSEGSREAVLAVLREAGLPAAMIDRCASDAQWAPAPSGMTMTPPPDVVLALPSQARQRLYQRLARLPENTDQRNPIPIALGSLDGPAAGHLAPEVIARVKSLLYGDGPWRLLADLPTLPAGLERTRVASLVMRAESYLVRLRIDANTDIDALAHYWTSTEGATETRPFMESLTRVPGGASVGVLRLLSRFARDHANRYPRPSDPIESRSDCFWTALNFGRDLPEGPTEDPAFVTEALKSRFHRRVGAPRARDLVMLFNDAGAPVHAAVYLADDLVFTKNGQGLLHPWTIMKLDSMLNLYQALAGKLRVVFVAERETSGADQRPEE